MSLSPEFFNSHFWDLMALGNSIFGNLIFHLRSLTPASEQGISYDAINEIALVIRGAYH